MADEEQFDEVLEEFGYAEHGEIAEVERMEVHERCRSVCD